MNDAPRRFARLAFRWPDLAYAAEVMARPALLFATLFVSSCGGASPHSAATASDGTTTTSGDTTSGGATTSAAVEASPICPPSISGGRVTLYGVVEKGPLLAGAPISVEVLDLQGEPTGELLEGATVDGLGGYAIPDVPAGPILVTVHGNFFDELAGAVSDEPAHLRAFGRASATSSFNVNVLTHLSAARARTLYAEGACLDDAPRAAEAEAAAFLQIGGGSFAPTRPASRSSVTGEDDDDNAYLLALGAVLLQGTTNQPAIQELLDQLAEAVDEELEWPYSWTLADVEAELPADLVLENLGDHLESLGRARAVPDIHRLLDQDGDGIPNAEDNCPNVHNKAQYDLDEDGIGDMCDCGDIPCDCGFGAPDADGDGYPDACDNCPDVANPLPPQDQTTWAPISDADHDGLGAACDACPNSPMYGAVPGEDCCDPVLGRDGCVRDWPGSTLWYTCSWGGSRFVCEVERTCYSLGGYGKLPCPHIPIAPPGGLATVFPEGVDCDVEDCGSRWCNLGEDSSCAGALNVCIPWYHPDEAPAFLENVGACARVDQGPCAGKVGRDCLYIADW